MATQNARALQDKIETCRSLARHTTNPGTLQAKIGVNCLIFQQVTIGTRGTAGIPQIGDNIDIGAGAKILGPVEIGTGARIGANAVITKDVEPGAGAVGISPASPKV